MTQLSQVRMPAFLELGDLLAQCISMASFPTQTSGLGPQLLSAICMLVTTKTTLSTPDLSVFGCQDQAGAVFCHRKGFGVRRGLPSVTDRSVLKARCLRQEPHGTLKFIGSECSCFDFAFDCRPNETGHSRSTGRCIAAHGMNLPYGLPSFPGAEAIPYNPRNDFVD
jgi:hypothetical protein